MMILRIAVNEDLNTVISWIKDKEACKLWAGPLSYTGKKLTKKINKGPDEPAQDRHVGYAADND